MDNLPKVFFSSVIKPLVSKEQDELLALASISNLKSFIPDVDVVNNSDLLPFACDACVVNRVNKNGHVIDTETAIAMQKTFINKPVNVEHDRKKIVGVILAVGFSEFGTDKSLSLEDIKDTKEPFNIVVGGVFWRLANKNLATVIEDAADPSSENYLGVSASWELGFSEFNFVLLKGKEKNIKHARFIKEAKDVEKLYTEFSAGKRIIDGENLYMQGHTDVKALGIAITETPAADVRGIFVEPNEKEEAEAKTNLGIEQKIEKIEEKISQAASPVVKKNSNIMKITRVEDITEEAMKEIKASEITSFINSELQKISDAHLAEKSAKDKAVLDAKAAAEQNASDLKSTKEELKKIQDTLASIQAAEVARAQNELFSQRMASWDAEFELDDEDRKAIASQIKSLDEEAYAAFQKNTAILMKNKKKGAKKVDEKELKDKEVKASLEAKAEDDAAAAAEQALANAKAENQKVPTGAAAEKQTLKEKFAKAFAPDQFVVSLK